MANVIRSRISTTLLLVGLLASLPAGRSWAQCLGDCDGGGSVGSGELTKIIAIINYCPCASPSVGGLAAGCAALPGGADKQCTAADRSGNGCITAGELTGVIADLLNFPSTGCPGLTPTNTPLNTPTNTLPPATSTRTNTPSATPTTPAPTATATFTATSAPQTAVCGNGVVDTGENCDLGGTCIGGTNAGTHCTAESDCVGEGICELGANAFRACLNDADCPDSRCIHCKTFTSATCASNCTTPMQVPWNLVPGVINPVGKKLADGTSGAVVHTIPGSLPVPALPMSGTQQWILGQPRNNQIPLVVLPSRFPPLQVSSFLCACVRGVIAKTCGGVLSERDGTLASDCTPNFGIGTCSPSRTCTVDSNCAGGQLCVSGSCTCQSNATIGGVTDCGSGKTCVVPDPCAGQKPCAFVHGPGNAASGVIGCDGLADANLAFSQDAGGSPNPPAPTPPPGSGPAVLTLRNACMCGSNSDCAAPAPGATTPTPGPTPSTCNTDHRCTCASTYDCPAGGMCVCPNGTEVCASGTTGACVFNGCSQNADCPGTLSCQPGPAGSILIVSSSAIGQSPVNQLCGIPTQTPAPVYGPDHHWCTDDDPQGAYGQPQTLPQVTGVATGVTTNTYTASGNVSLGPFAVIGKPISCSALAAPTPSLAGAGTVGAFTALNQPKTGTIVTTNLQYSQ